MPETERLHQRWPTTSEKLSALNMYYGNARLHDLIEKWLRNNTDERGYRKRIIFAVDALYNELQQTVTGSHSEPVKQ